MDEKKTLTTIEEAKVFSDPYRLMILQQFYAFGIPATVKQVADMMKETPAKVHYHVKKMEAAGILVLVYTKEINGIIAKYYEPAARNFDISSENIPETTGKLIFSETQNMVSNIFNNSRDIIIDELKNGNKGKTGCRFAVDELYLTAEEANDVVNYITELCNRKNKINLKSENTRKKHLFFVLCDRNE